MTDSQSKILYKMQAYQYLYFSNFMHVKEFRNTDVRFRDSEKTNLKDLQEIIK